MRLQQLQVYIKFIIGASVLFEGICYVKAFTFASKFRGLRSGTNGGSYKPPLPPSSPPPRNPPHSFWEDFDYEDRKFLAVSILATDFDNNLDNENEEAQEVDGEVQNHVGGTHTTSFNDTLFLRGGSDDIIAGTKSTLESTSTYWSNKFDSIQSSLGSTLNRLNPFSNTKKDETDDDQDVTKIPVQNVLVPGSTVLPDSIVRSAGQRSGLVGSVMRSDRVQECAKQLKKWYLQRGYVLHSVTGATLHAENGTATLSVEEPRSASVPIDISFAKLVPLDPESGEKTTLRKYKAKLETKRGRGLKVEEWDKLKSQLNSTLVEAKGRTNPRTIAKRLGLQSGAHFKWDGQLWQNIAQSGIFARVWKASPVKMSDGSVQVQVLAQESPPRNLEYGIQKSLYTGNWEGELDFNYANVFGGGETLGLKVRRGAKDPEPSVKIQFTDDKFGMPCGYDTELFSEYIEFEKPKKKKVAIDQGKGDESENGNEETPDAAINDVVSDEEPTPEPGLVITSTEDNDDDDEILSRRGLRFNLRSPISRKLVERSSASTALERTSTRGGQHETIASGTIRLGPFIRNLPLGAKTSLTTSVTSGTRVGNERSWKLLPYSSQVSTARQLFPILTETISFPNGDNIKLAIETTMTSSTRHQPRHEANAMGLATTVRGYSSSSNGPLSGSLFGTAEVRIPVTIPFQKVKINQDGKVVLFGDWMYGSKNTEGTTHKTSVGIGLRKTVQGIPLKYDVSFNSEGKIGGFLGLGNDWDI